MAHDDGKGDHPVPRLPKHSDDDENGRHPGENESRERAWMNTQDHGAEGAALFTVFVSAGPAACGLKEQGKRRIGKGQEDRGKDNSEAGSPSIVRGGRRLHFGQTPGPAEHSDGMNADAKPAGRLGAHRATDRSDRPSARLRRVVGRQDEGGSL